MDEMSRVTALSAAAVALITAIVAARIKLRKAKADEVVEQRKLTDAESRAAFEEAKAAYLLLVEAFKDRVAILERTVVENTTELKESAAAHLKCQVETAELRGRLAVAEVKLERLESHDKRNTEHVSGLQKVLVDKAAKVIEEQQSGD
jgi:hypothetical protein